MTTSRRPVTIEYEGDKDAVYSTAGRGETFADVLARRISRRGLVKSAAATASALAVTGPLLTAAQEGTPGATPAASPTATGYLGSLAFEPISLDEGDQHLVPAGYVATPLLKWGDALFADAPEFDATAQTAASQAMQFGYNNDWVAYLPLPMGSDTADHGLLVVNHEYTNPELMFPGYLTANPDYKAPAADSAPPDVPEFLANPTKEIVDVELEAHGLSVVEVQRDAAGLWQVVRDSGYNRRITATTPTVVTGPAAGHELLKTSGDPTGAAVTGTLNNCAGGLTPWGTAVSGEENFQQYFANLAALGEDDPVYAAHARFGIGEEASERQWESFYDRFDVSKEPNEPFRYGWAVEFDPYDPTSTPKKRTALGRNKHEGHTSVLAPGGQAVVYGGDDSRFEYAYKFVSAGTFNPDDRAANMELLDEGTLHVATFNDDGTGEWIPLVYGQGELTEANGFASQGDVLVNTRFAADAVGATKMDRPEDFETNPVTRKVYLVCTNNDRRTLEETDKANPRVDNTTGHIIEITETGDDHASTTFEWAIFILAGDPANGGAYYGGFADLDLVSPFASPDNLTFDTSGNLWLSTDGMPASLPGNDGLFVVPTEGEERGFARQFFSAVPGSEVSGPVFNLDDTALFLSVQHPGEGGSFEQPVSTWPTGETPPRPSVVVVTTQGPTAGRIGS